MVSAGSSLTAPVGGYDPSLATYELWQTTSRNTVGSAHLVPEGHWATRCGRRVRNQVTSRPLDAWKAVGEATVDHVGALGEAATSKAFCRQCLAFVYGDLGEPGTEQRAGPKVFQS